VSVKEKIEGQQLVRVGARHIAVTERGTGDPVVLLHGGGPGASGMSNYARNVDALAGWFRVIVPDSARLRAVQQGPGPVGPVRRPRRHRRWAARRARLRPVAPGRQLLRRAAALRLALERPERVGRMVLMGPGGIGTTRRPPTPGLKRLLGYYGGDGPTRAKLERFIRRTWSTTGLASART
jgi:2-hydroxy-6-oxonona-2,4-dienedioate hydrolase/4,5:9,10-diseco-3-hydroxy-5,9,17-trioxoandrosta-1(10),2-diene-4-oate hydrolase